jgi:hypothetical protein
MSNDLVIRPRVWITRFVLPPGILAWQLDGAVGRDRTFVAIRHRAQNHFGKIWARRELGCSIALRSGISDYAHPRHAAQSSITYSWDDANQLTTIGTSASFSYTPDAQRQTLAINDNGNTTVTTNYAYDPASERLTGISYGST